MKNSPLPAFGDGIGTVFWSSSISRIVEVGSEQEGQQAKANALHRIRQICTAMRSVDIAPAPATNIGKMSIANIGSCEGGSTTGLAGAP